MKILILSGEYPKPYNPNSACFVNERLKNYRNNGIDFNILSAIEKPSIMLKCYRKLKGIATFELGDELIYDNIKYNFIYYKQGIFDRFLFRHNYGKTIASAILKAINIDDYDLIVVHFAYPLGLAAYEIYKSRLKPYIVVSHGSDIHYIPFTCQWLRKDILNVLETAKSSIFVSNRLLEIAKSIGYSASNSTVIPNGVNTELFKRSYKDDAKRNLGISINSKCVGFVGNLIHVKRADKLVQIFNEINKRLQDVYFLVIGDGEMKKQMIVESKTFDINIRFTGNIMQVDMPKYMNAMDVMLLPSRNEGWPCVVLEAQSCGTPVVGSDRGGIPEAIADGGLIVEEGRDFELRFANATIKLLLNPMSPGYLERKASDYSWDITAKKETDIMFRSLKS